MVFDALIYRFKFNSKHGKAVLVVLAIMGDSITFMGRGITSCTSRQPQEIEVSIMLL